MRSKVSKGDPAGLLPEALQKPCICSSITLPPRRRHGVIVGKAWGLLLLTCSTVRLCVRDRLFLDMMFLQGYGVRITEYSFHFSLLRRVGERKKKGSTPPSMTTPLRVHARISWPLVFGVRFVPLLCTQAYLGRQHHRLIITSEGGQPITPPCARGPKLLHELVTVGEFAPSVNPCARPRHVDQCFVQGVLRTSDMFCDGSPR